MRNTRRNTALLVAVILNALFGIVLIVGGIWLIAVGGSWYYALAGAAFLATATLLFRRKAAALWLYAALVLATLAWALWEAGLDWWPLAARGDILFLLGLFLLTPWVTRPLLRQVRTTSEARRQDARAARRASLPLMGSLLLFLIVAVASWFVDPHRIEGTLPGVRSQAAADSLGVPSEEWHAYGRTSHGQRYSPLKQITPDNVSRLEVAWHYETGDVRGREGDPVETTFEVTPLKIGERLYLCTPHQSVIALDATSGKEIWRYDPQIRNELALQHLTCRGLSYYDPAKAAPAQAGASSETTATTAKDATGAAGSAPLTDRQADAATSLQELNLPVAAKMEQRPTGAPPSYSCRRPTGGSLRSIRTMALYARISEAGRGRSICGPICLTYGLEAIIRPRRLW